jgi:LasA protease
MAAGRRIRSNVRNRRRQRSFFLASLALFAALLACSNSYLTAADIAATSAARTGVPQQNTLSAIGGGGETFTAHTPVADTLVPTATLEDPATPTPSLTPTPTPNPDYSPTPAPTTGPPILYYTQAGDTLPSLAVRFGVNPDEITSPDPISPQSFLNPGQLLIIPRKLGETSSDKQIMPDSEVVFSPSAIDFDVEDFVKKAGGYLSTYQEYLGSTGWTTGAGVIKRVAIENSINPRLLLAILEFQSHWVYGQPRSLAQTDYPMGYINSDAKGLYQQLSWAVMQLSLGYYGWREGLITDLTFPDGSKVRPAPSLNAGTLALQYLFSRLYNRLEWNGVLYGDQSLPALHEQMFGNPWLRAETVEPLFPATLTQPPLILPFYPGHIWSFTGGPHAAWGDPLQGARAALDFAPASIEPGCVKSDEWVLAAASGLVVRSERGVVVLDLDGDGHEQTGWSLLYLHIATDGRVPVGKMVNVGDPIGHPSCEGGTATGTHVHIARKYNGEWILAGGPLPFDLSGWIAHAGPNPYDGTLTKDGKTVTACSCGSIETNIMRTANDN